MDWNVASRLTTQSQSSPDGLAIAAASQPYRPGRHRSYHHTRFAALENRVQCIAAGLQAMGMGPGHRIVLLVRFGEDFITLVFALLRVGVTLVLIDPGMGRKNMLGCIQAVDPHGFVAIPAAQAVVKLLGSRFPSARFFVTVGKRLGVLPSPTLSDLERSRGSAFQQVPRQANDPAAIIFTTGSTGPPKGVLYTHGMFCHQIDQLVEHYGIRPGGKDLSGFPLFGLFNAVMGTSTIVPDMDPTRPADVDPPRLLDAIDQWQVNQAFGSPALWTRISQYCKARQRRIESLRFVLSAGAPVAAWILADMRASIHPEGTMHTPYGATEALPVASIESRMVLKETARGSGLGKGTCVGHRFSGIQWKVIAIEDGPLPSIDQVQNLGPGEIGELMVSGPVVSPRYVTRLEQNGLHKVVDGDRIWHRMGDVGYLDETDRFWFCGRKSHRVRTSSGDMFTEPCESIVNQLECVYRSALVGVGPVGQQLPIIVVEPWPEHRPSGAKAREKLVDQVGRWTRSHPETVAIQRVLVYPRRLPTDIRHNSKIFREQLAPWAEKEALRGNP